MRERPKASDFYEDVGGGKTEFNFVRFHEACDKYCKERTDDEWARDIYEDLCEFLKDEAADLLELEKEVTLEQIKAMCASDRVWLERCGMSIPDMGVVHETLARAAKALKEKGG